MIVIKPKAVKNKDGEITGYLLRVFLGKNENGVPQEATRVWKLDKQYTPKQLEKELQKQSLAFEDEVKQTKFADGNATFKQFSDKWIAEVSTFKHKKRTTSSYKQMLVRINEGIGSMKINKITPQTINSFLNSLRKEKDELNALSSKSIRNYHTVLSSIFTTAVKWKVIADSPMDGVDRPKVVKAKVESLSKSDVEKLFELLDEEAPVKYQLFIKIAILSGMRRGEIVGLKWHNVDFDKHLIHIESTILYDNENGVFEDTTKNEYSERTIKLSDSIFELLKKQKELQRIKKFDLGDAWIDNDFIFTRWNGEIMHPNTPYTWFRRFQDNHGLKHCSIHQLRHTSATLLIMEGANVKLVSGRLGHSNTSTTTNIYTSYFKEADEMAVEALDNILGLK